MPIKLHVDTAWPLNDRIASNRIRKRRYEDIGPLRFRRSDCTIEIGDEIARPLRTEWIRNGSLESKERNCAYPR